MRRRQFLSAGAITVAAGAAAAASPAGAAEPDQHRAYPDCRVLTGYQVLERSGFRSLAGRRVGIIANPTSVLPDLTHEVDQMHASPEVNLIAVFGPEHGFRGTAQAGGSQGYYIDAQTGLPVYDLYGADIAGSAALITKSGIDVLLIDLLDISTRFYTYIWTMYRALAACAQLGIPFVVLDRPNPAGGIRATGPVLHPHWETDVGFRPIAQQHGMTMGELAKLFNAEFVPADANGKRADLTVSRVRGWQRGEYWDATGLPFVLPSPNIPTLDSALVYPGLGMFEGTNLSEGRGTTKPFQTIGAPYIGYHWVDSLRSQDLPGVDFREAYFIPTFNKYVNETCGGVELFITDRRRFDPITTGVAMMITAKRIYPEHYAWRYDTGDPIDPYWVDKLSGSDYLRKAIDAGKSTSQVVAGWQGELEAFRRLRSRFLLYR